MVSVESGELSPKSHDQAVIGTTGVDWSVKYIVLSKHTFVNVNKASAKQYISTVNESVSVQFKLSVTSKETVLSPQELNVKLGFCVVFVSGELYNPSNIVQSQVSIVPVPFIEVSIKLIGWLLKQPSCAKISASGLHFTKISSGKVGEVQLFVSVTVSVTGKGPQLLKVWVNELSVSVVPSKFQSQVLIGADGLFPGWEVPQIAVAVPSQTESNSKFAIGGQYTSKSIVIELSVHPWLSITNKSAE